MDKTPNPEVVVEGIHFDGTFWEPQVDTKGDVARLLFYMAIRYDGERGEPDLELIVGDSPDIEGEITRELGDLEDLLVWHAEDPVSAEEIQRHEMIVAEQGNMNPFIT